MERERICVLHLLAVFILDEEMLLPFSSVSSVYGLLCLQSDIERVDMSAASFTSRHPLLLLLSSILAGSYDICWHQAVQNIK